MNDEFPAELKQFIAQHIESLAQLEAMLLLHREPRANGRRGLARELYISADMCRRSSPNLERRGLAARDRGRRRFRYASRDAEVDRLLGQLADTYRERRVAVITEIYSNPVKKVQTFADAFRLRREDQYDARRRLSALRGHVPVVRRHALSRLRAIPRAAVVLERPVLCGADDRQPDAVRRPAHLSRRQLVIWRKLPGLIAIVLLLFGLIWESE